MNRKELPRVDYTSWLIIGTSFSNAVPLALCSVATPLSLFTRISSSRFRRYPLLVRYADRETQRGGSKGRESFHGEGGVSSRSSYADTHARLHGILTASSSSESRAKRRSLLERERTLRRCVRDTPYSLLLTPYSFLLIFLSLLLTCYSFGRVRFVTCYLPFAHHTRNKELETTADILEKSISRVIRLFIGEILGGC